jgi:hypothetical protein
MKLRPVVQHGAMLYRTRNSLTDSTRSISDRAACCVVSVNVSIGLSFPTPTVLAE